MEDRLMQTDDIINYFGFGKTKMNELFQSGVLPVVKVGRDYITTKKAVEDWVKDNIGKEIFY
jgi:hypothetical protein